MKISIITINYNNAFGLENTFRSVFSQLYKGFEYIVVDGGSTDASVEIIRNNNQDISFWVSERDTGIYNAINKGIAKATGDYLIFLNSGDCFSEPESLQKCNDFIEKNPDADVYYGDIFVVNDKRSTTKWLRKHPDYLTLDFFQKDTINHQASLIRAELFNQFGSYPEHYKVASDYWLFLNCLLNNKKFYSLGFPMVDYDLTGISFNNHDYYRLEKQKIWESLVPLCVQEVMNECEEYKAKLRDITGTKLVRTAMNINMRYQKQKKTLFYKRVISLLRKRIFLQA